MGYLEVIELLEVVLYLSQAYAFEIEVKHKANYFRIAFDSLDRFSYELSPTFLAQVSLLDTGFGFSLTSLDYAVRITVGTAVSQLLL